MSKEYRLCTITDHSSLKLFDLNWTILKQVEGNVGCIALYGPNHLIQMNYIEKRQDLARKQMAHNGGQLINLTFLWVNKAPTLLSASKKV